MAGEVKTGRLRKTAGRGKDAPQNEGCGTRPGHAAILLLTYNVGRNMLGG
jgi:hypothetical protein